MGRRSVVLWSAVLAVAASAATAALAADLPVAPTKAPSYYQPPPPAHYNWSGFYFGGHVGAGLVRDVVTFPVATLIGAPAGPNVGTIAAGTATNVTPYAIIGGTQVGANLQFGPAVVGVEGTWTASYISGNYTAPLAPSGQEQSRSAPHWYATMTGKIGYAADDWLFYAKGGGAWMRVDYTQSALSGVAPVGVLITQQTVSANRSGWTAGAGVEYALNENLSAKLEYDFLDFGSANYNFPSMVAIGTAPLPVTIKSQTHMFLAGMNYRFYFGGF